LPYLNVSLDANFLEGILEDPEVLNELIIVFGLPVDLGHVDCAGMDDVCDLAVDCA
jgi:hypothetical protein